MKSRFHVQIVSSKPINSYGTTQLRCLQHAEYLQAYGHQVEVSQIYKVNPIKRGIIFAHRAINDKYTNAFLSLAKVRGNIIIYDTDDLIYRFNNKIRTNTGSKDFNRLALLRGLAMMKCDVVTVSTDYLANKARETHEDVRVVRNALSKDFSMQAQKIHKEKQGMAPGTTTIGYFSGSQTHDRDFLLVEKTLIRLLQERNDVKVLLVGKLSFSEKFYSFVNRFNYVKFLPYKKFITLYRDVDINLIPLELEDDFCQSKSELKYIEAGACGVVSVASATDTFKRVIINGVNGFLIESNEWYEVLSRLISSFSFRKDISERAYRDIDKKYSADIRAKELNDILQDISLNYFKRCENKLFFSVAFISFTKLATIRILKKIKKTLRDVLKI